MLHQMRTKNFVLFLTCIVGTSILLCLVGNQRPTIHNIVSETHKQLNNLKNFKENLKVAEQKRLVADEKYLHALGFTPQPQLYPNSLWKNVSCPLIISAVIPSEGQLGVGFVRSAQHHLPNHTVFLYDMGMNHYELELLVKYCNSSRCQVVPFMYHLFPAHVAEHRLHAYRPLLIQDALNKAGAVIWLEIDHRFTTGNLQPFLQQAQKSGILAWSIEYPTTSLTHPKMFDYFHSVPESFFFHRMVEPLHLIIYNTGTIHKMLMLPWVQCVLTPDCIDPIGAQSSGCRFDKKPHYRYSGCHRYDMSALNIVLGLMFNFDEKPYVIKDRFFRKMNQDVTQSESEHMNSTDSLTSEKRTYN